MVTTFNRLPWLRLSLRGWERQTCRSFALTVADDGSGPETADFVADFARTAPFPVDHVWRENRGYRRGAILNEAVRRSEGEPLLLFTDGDCVPPATFLERHVAACGPRTLCVAGCVALGPEESGRLTEADVDAGRHEGLGSPSVRRALRRRGRRTRILSFLRRPRHPRLIGLNVAIDRSLFEEVNGYDEAFVGWGREDVDLRDRLMAVRPRPRVRVLWGQNDTIHLWHPPASSKSEDRNRAYFETERPPRCVLGLGAERDSLARGPVALPPLRTPRLGS